MPQLIPDTDFDKKFSDLERNHDDVAYFMSRGVSDYIVDGLNLPGNYRLVKARQSATHLGNEKIRIRLIHTNESGNFETVYAVDLVVFSDLLESSRHCTQVMLWRSPDERHDRVLFGFAKMMFNHFIDEYIVIATDTEQTAAGRRFWQVRILNAINNGKYVYFSDLNDLNEDLMLPNIIPITSEKEFTDTWFDHGWGKNEEYKDRLFFISKDEL